MKNNNKNDWSEDVSETEKLFIKAVLKDIEEGNTFSHDQVMRDIRKIYGL